MFPDAQKISDVVNLMSITENRDASIVGIIGKRKWCFMISSADFEIKVVPSIKLLYNDAFFYCFPVEFHSHANVFRPVAGLSVKVEVRRIIFVLKFLLALICNEIS